MSRSIWSSSSRLRRSFWNGALTCRSWIALRHSSVDGTVCSRRRSLRKYKTSSEGTTTAAAIAPACQFVNVGNQFMQKPSSSEEPALPEVVQHQRVERHRGAREQVRAAAAGDVVLERQAVGVQVGLVLLDQRLSDADL